MHPTKRLKENSVMLRERERERERKRERERERKKERKRNVLLAYLRKRVAKAMLPAKKIATLPHHGTRRHP
jgi:hypothetical protein